MKVLLLYKNNNKTLWRLPATKLILLIFFQWIFRITFKLIIVMSKKKPFCYYFDMLASLIYPPMLESTEHPHTPLQKIARRRVISIIICLHGDPKHHFLGWEYTLYFLTLEIVTYFQNLFSIVLWYRLNLIFVVYIFPKDYFISNFNLHHCNLTILRHHTWLIRLHSKRFASFSFPDESSK